MRKDIAFFEALRQDAHAHRISFALCMLLFHVISCFYFSYAQFWLYDDSAAIILFNLWVRWVSHTLSMEYLYKKHFKLTGTLRAQTSTNNSPTCYCTQAFILITYLLTGADFFLDSTNIFFRFGIIKYTSVSFIIMPKKW